MAARLSHAVLSQIAIPLLFWTAVVSFGAEEAHAFKCCWDHQFSADSQEECAEHHCSVHGAQDSCDFLGVGDSYDDTGGESSGGESSAPRELSASEAALLSAVEGLAYQVGYEIGKSLAGPSAAEKAAEAARRRAATAELQLEADALEQARTRQLQSDTAELLGQMRGVELAELQPQELGSSRKLDFQSYAQRMNDTRGVLDDLRRRVAAGKEEKELLDWCLLNIPLYPTQPIQPIPEDRYQTMLERYWARKSAWDTRCRAAVGASNAGSSASLSFKDLSPPDVPASGIRGIEPKSWEACLNDYNRNVRGCEAGDHLNQKMFCINTQIKEWQQCIGRGSAQPAAIPQVDASVTDPSKMKGQGPVPQHDPDLRDAVATTRSEPPSPTAVMAQQLITQHSGRTGLDEEGLATALAARLTKAPETAQEVLKQLGSEDRDDVAYELLARTSEKSLKTIADDPKGTPFLKQLVEELNSGVVTDEEIQQVQRVITRTSQTHGRLMTEELRPEVQEALKNAGATLQPISKGFGGLHFDEYALVIDRMPPRVTPEAFLASALRDPHRAINYDPDFWGWNEFERRSKSSEPKPGDIYNINMRGPENGDVVLSDNSPNHFTFATINTGSSGHGEHPLYGNREFGMERNPDGTVTFYTRGASRAAGVAEQVGSPIPQDRTWKAMMDGVRHTIEAKGGKIRDGSFTVHEDPFRRKDGVRQ